MLTNIEKSSKNLEIHNLVNAALITVKSTCLVFDCHGFLDVIIYKVHGVCIVDMNSYGLVENQICISCHRLSFDGPKPWEGHLF